MKSTRAEWAARIARQRESGLTIGQYAAQIGVRPRTLSWWKWQLGLKPKPALVRRATTPVAKAAVAISPLTFVEMTSAVESDRLELVLRSDVRVRVRPGFDGGTLGRLLDVLEARR
jgi:hypothetical protein